MKKKAQMDYVLLMCILAVIVLLILLRLDKFIISILQAKDENIACVVSASFQSMAKSMSGPAKIAVTKLHCPRHDATIVMTKKEAEQMEKQNKNEDYYYIDNPIPNDYLKKYVLTWYNQHADMSKGKETRIDSDYFNKKQNPNHLYEYRMNEIIANEMKSCWNQLGRGELDLFNDLGNPIEYEDTAFQDGFFSDIKDSITDLRFKLTKGRCVVCSRILFDNNVRKEFGDAQIESLPLWTQVHPVKIISKNSISYYEFLLDESIPKDFFQTSQNKRYYYSPSKPYIVVFKRIGLNPITGTATVALFKKIFGKDKDYEIDSISLMPYEELYTQCESVEN